MKCNMGLVFPDPKNVRKIFMGGLSSCTTKESLWTYFSCFGEIVDCVVIKNNESDKSRGFGFATLKAPDYISKSPTFKITRIRWEEY